MLLWYPPTHSELVAICPILISILPSGTTGRGRRNQHSINHMNDTSADVNIRLNDLSGDASPCTQSRRMHVSRSRHCLATVHWRPVLAESPGTDSRHSWGCVPGSVTKRSPPEVVNCRSPPIEFVNVTVTGLPGNCPSKPSRRLSEGTESKITWLNSTCTPCTLMMH